MSDMPLRTVAELLPGELSAPLDRLTAKERASAEELRLRRGFPLSVLLPAGERCPGGRPVTEGDLRTVLELASQASAHTVLEQMRGGFVTLRGGHRMGLCGTVARRDGEIVSLRYLSSLSLRIARDVRGLAAPLLPGLTEGGRFVSTLILGPPGSGKTTLLRDLIRCLSDGEGVPAHRVGVVDERGEIAALWQGEPQFPVGRHTDILDGCPKAEGILMLLRAVNPQVLAVDEITRSADAGAMLEAEGCGAALLATAHGGSSADLERRPVYRALLSAGVFRRLILLERQGGRRLARTEVLP